MCSRFAIESVQRFVSDDRDNTNTPTARQKQAQTQTHTDRNTDHVLAEAGLVVGAEA